MKKLIALTSLLLSHSAIGATQVGLMFGSDNGISAKVDDIRVNVGFNEFSISGDKLFDFDQSEYFYYGFGAKLSDHKNHKLGARAVFGAQTMVEQFNFHIEAQPVVYLVDSIDVKLEFSAGVRYQF
ncbi:hypothetical protein DBZ36_05480 [Alginatibacterium sediminis]|uniref:Outer membrane protein beta-barrel domain-containing protein n=1 Tax=Alginatibacterium sediminis TaxID=2164068 RepID=A0A420EGR7_9ALTE|nr:hypothetical protein [Alginatibacterium sediminis]RKF19911.1 hypothetical protein DBZ36_05480 [Alginatibacterium sediminis]